MDSAKDLIRTYQDVKDIFWNKVENENLSFSGVFADDIKSLIL